MNPKTQYHIGALLKALGDLGQHLMGVEPETTAPAITAPAITGEPTIEKSPRQRKSKTVEPPPAEPVGVSSVLAAEPEPEPEKTLTGVFKSYEDAKEFINPLITAARTPEVKAILAKLNPDGKDTLRALVMEHPELHAEFRKLITPLLPVAEEV